MRWALRFLVLGWAVCGAAGASTDNLVTNGGFESGMAGWRPMWCRDAAAGKAEVETQVVRSGSHALRIEHRGEKDWSLEPELRLRVRPGELFDWETWARLEGSGSATLCASTWDARGQVVSWSYAERTIEATREWTRVSTHFVVPPGVAEIQPRLIGSRPATVWVDDFGLVQKPGWDLASPKVPGGELALTNAVLVVRVDTTNGAFSVLDRRSGRSWKQAAEPADVAVTGARRQGNQIELTLLHFPSVSTLKATLALDRARAELTMSVSGTGALSGPLGFPYPFTSQPGDWLVVPMNEGISYPVEDASIEPFRLVAYGGHGICMAFWGVTDGEQGQEAIIETPDDAAIQLRRVAGRLVIAPEWDPQKGRFGYARKLRYVFFDHGGHVAMAKRYREYVRQNGQLKTLTEKRGENPNVDLLVGAVNVWNWDSDPVGLVKEMQAAGIEHILWSSGGSPSELRGLNAMHVLTSRYDIYQDVMDPANFPLLQWKHPDWTTAGWPADIILQANGDWLRGWGVEGKDGRWFYCGVLCDSRALDYARRRIPAELATRPYRCRFIDTTTASPWRECYSPKHPMTRSDSRQWKMKLLGFVSHDMKLVTGSETGHDAAVPYVDYFEGMLSLGPYRVPDAGRDMQRIWTNVPERVAKFQLGQKYRLPLWELVYHDCVVAQWYWGDYNNKLPSLWDKRDLFNLLYGTPPMFMFDHRLWEEQKARFVQSYRNTCPYVRAAGYAEMTDHRFLTPDRNVQQTVFANGMKVTVNFGDRPYRMRDGEVVRGKGFRVEGIH